MTPLVDRLRAAIEERLALAEPTTPGPWANTGQEGLGDAWQIHGGPTEETTLEWPDDGGQPIEVPVRHRVATLNYEDGGGVWRKEDADHIVANQPSAVIARCKADLWILHELADPSHCEDCTNGSDMAGTIHECPVDGVKRTVIRLLAEGYGITEEEK